MKAATVSQLKKELSYRSPQELLELCLRLSKFKKENKELLTYLLFESGNDTAFIQSVKLEIDAHFHQINTKKWFYIKKSVRKILRLLKKYARYSGKKETEAELLIHFCIKMKNFSPSIKRDKTMQNLYDRQLLLIHKLLSTIHEDLQYDYRLRIEEEGL